MDLLKKLLLKNPRERLAASQALKHPAFTYIQDKIPKSEGETDTRVSLKAPNLKDFHEKYKNFLINLDTNLISNNFQKLKPTSQIQ